MSVVRFLDEKHSNSKVLKATVKAVTDWKGTNLQDPILWWQHGWASQTIEILSLYNPHTTFILTYYLHYNIILLPQWRKVVWRGPEREHDANACFWELVVGSGVICGRFGVILEILECRKTMCYWTLVRIVKVYSPQLFQISCKLFWANRFAFCTSLVCVKLRAAWETFVQKSTV